MGKKLRIPARRDGEIAELTRALDDIGEALARTKAAVARMTTPASAKEDAANLALLAAAEAESAGHDTIPNDVAKRLFAGENPVKVFREWRGITQIKLAREAGIGQGFLSDIERGKPASAAVYKQLADALRVSLDILIP